MNDTRPVVGADLYELWRAANIGLANVRLAYIEQSEKLHAIGASHEERFGRTHPWWAWVASQLEDALFLTNGRLAAGSGALNSAIDVFKYVDASNSKDLTDAGKGLEDILNNPNRHDPKTEIPDDKKPGSGPLPRRDEPGGRE